MYKVTMTFDVKKKADNDAVQKLWSLVAAYSQAGQLIGDCWVTQSASGKSLSVTGVAHEKTAFAPRYLSRLGREASLELKPLIRKKPRLIWELFAEDSRTCACDRTEGLLFSPDVLLEASPFRCWICRGRKPAYRLGRRIDPFSYRNLARQWTGFYWTWMESGLTEALAWRQLADPESELSKMARKKLRELEKELRVPVYYDLFSHYISRLVDPPEATICPGCGRGWTSVKKGGLCCSRCRLFSSAPVDGQPPDWWRPLPRQRR